MNALVRWPRRAFAVLLFLTCLHATVWGQPKAAFTASTLSGCSPLVVYFFDSSTGNPTQWRWDLGNGVTSFLRNPSATYFNPGTYTVKLVISNSAGKDSVIKSEYITVYDRPSVAFGFDKLIGCFPLPVQFTDSSTAGSGTIVSRQWDFGDGTISNAQNPLHTYTTAGVFTVTLKITNSFGCVKSVTKEQAITINGGVKAAFTASDPGLCPAPASVQFTNGSTGPGPLQYHWLFGDGNSSTAASPTYSYNTNGNFTVRLVAISPEGCADTVTKNELFKIGSAKADFLYPAVTCVNSTVQFTDASSPTPVSVKWDFGDGTKSTVRNPIKFFPKTGTLTVRLISDFGNCIDTVKKPIRIEAYPVADFTIAQQAFCRLPANVKFTPASSGFNYKYFWDFGDSTTSTSASPSHTYTQEGMYTIKFVVTNASGCSDSVVKKDFLRIERPKINVKGLPKNGCGPITINPSAYVDGKQSITSYYWDFGDGAASTDSTPTHTYSKTGNYNLSLIVTTTQGCTDTLLFSPGVRVGDKPHADFIHTPIVVCPYEKVYFTNKSTGGADQWFWDFGDGGTSMEQNPVHQYGDTGWHDIKLVAFNNTCPDTMVLTKGVYVNPPISMFEVRDDCNDKYTKLFADKSLGAQTWFWEFGDGSTSSIRNPSHTYATKGVYQVKLTVTSATCTHYSTRTIKVIDEKAAFTASDTILCRNGIASFIPVGIDTTKLLRSWWTYGDGAISKTAMPAPHTYALAGTYTVTLTLTDLLGCVSSASKALRVFGPTAAFQPNVGAACLVNNNIGFTDSSTPDGQHPITKWIWNYGDSTLDSATAAPFQHQYTKAGTYAIGLTVVDDYGCRDSITITAAVIIAQPVAAFVVSDSLSCIGKTLLFTNKSTGIEPVYQWWFGDGGMATTESVSRSYADTGFYSIKLLVTDKYGCRDSIEKKDFIGIYYPKAAFTMSDSIGTCPPLLVHFTNESTGYKSLYWNFGDGNTSVLDTPSHFYSMPGTYYATLVATSYGGCTDTMRKKIVVKGPTGTFTYAPLTGCKPLTVNFKATTKNKASFIWDFSDGSTLSNKDSIATHTYVSAGDFVPKIILTDSGGCTVPVLGPDTIRVKGIVTDFAMNKAAFCNDGLVQFSNETVSNDYIKSYQWSFGDGSTSTAFSPTHHYALPGSYTVQLMVTTESGCTDKKLLTDTIKVYANPVVQILGDSTACAPANLTFKGLVKSGTPSLLNWNWNFANGNTGDGQDPDAQSYNTDGVYTITTIATDDHGCSDTATKTITLFPTPKTDAGADQWICRGSVYNLKATGATRYVWQPAASLSCTACDGPLAAPLDSTQYLVTGFNEFGCSKSDSVIIRVHQPFTLTVEKGDTICAGTTIRLAASGADQYTWTPSLDVKSPTAGVTTAMPATTTLYKVVAKDNYNCFTDSGSVFIKVWPIPTVKVDNAITLSVGNTINLRPTYSADVSAYQWSNAQTLSCATCPSPVAHPKTETRYSIDVKNDGGCAAKADITVYVICNDGNLFIPNTFSPNIDGRNDRFYPRGTGISKIKSMKIFNRWGEMVYNRENFDANNASAGWDGTYKGQALISDVYVYTCEVVCMNNEVLTYRGDVTLLR